jgi:hypothetical protein
MVQSRPPLGIDTLATLLLHHFGQIMEDSRRYLALVEESSAASRDKETGGRLLGSTVEYFPL